MTHTNLRNCMRRSTVGRKGKTSHMGMRDPEEEVKACRESAAFMRRH